MLPCPVCPAAASHISGTRSPFVRGRLLCLLLRGPRPPPPECLATGLTILAPGTDLGTTCALSSPGRARGEAWTPRGSKSSLVVCLWLSQALGMTQTSPSCVPTAALTVLWTACHMQQEAESNCAFQSHQGLGWVLVLNPLPFAGPARRAAWAH